MSVRLRLLTGIAILLTNLAVPAAAQTRPAPIVEAVVGTSGFVDEVFDYFTSIGGGARFFVSRRIALGGEALWMNGADDTSAQTFTATATFDLVDDARRVVPYIVAGGGYLRQTALVGGGPGSTTLEPFTSSEGTVSGGAGARIALGRRVFVAPEFRLGFEPTTRFTVMIGFRPGR
jgi:hypothetical protein